MSEEFWTSAELYKREKSLATRHFNPKTFQRSMASGKTTKDKSDMSYEPVRVTKDPISKDVLDIIVL